MYELELVSCRLSNTYLLHKLLNLHLLHHPKSVLPVLPSSRAEKGVSSKHNMTTTTATYITLLLFAKIRGTCFIALDAR
jgi:hypothetical protein